MVGAIGIRVKTLHQLLASPVQVPHLITRGDNSYKEHFPFWRTQYDHELHGQLNDFSGYCALPYVPCGGTTGKWNNCCQILPVIIDDCWEYHKWLTSTLIVRGPFNKSEVTTPLMVMWDDVLSVDDDPPPNRPLEQRGCCFSLSTGLLIFCLWISLSVINISYSLQWDCHCSEQESQKTGGHRAMCERK